MRLGARPVRRAAQRDTCVSGNRRNAAGRVPRRTEGREKFVTGGVARPLWYPYHGANRSYPVTNFSPVKQVKINDPWYCHFTIDEALDRQILDACRTADKERLCTLPVQKLNSGSSEIRNWIATAGAAEHLTTQWQEYVPCYRSEAGTGCGMAFAVWA